MVKISPFSKAPSLSVSREHRSSPHLQKYFLRIRSEVSMKLAYENILINLYVHNLGCIVCFCALHVLDKSSTTMLHPPLHSLLYINLIANSFKIFINHSLIKPRTLQSIYKNLNCNLIPLPPVKHIYSCILDTNTFPGDGLFPSTSPQLPLTYPLFILHTVGSFIFFFQKGLL